jgi:hypothetical protein
MVVLPKGKRPTGDQLGFLKEIGIDVPDGLTRDAVDNLIHYLGW